MLQLLTSVDRAQKWPLTPGKPGDAADPQDMVYEPPSQGP